MIVDASVLLRAFFPDEDQPRAQALLREHAAGYIQLKAPDLLQYELANAVCRAERGRRIQPGQADQILQSLVGLDILILPLEWGEMLPMARRFGRCAYDAAYLALAARLGEPLITGDERLYHSVQAHLDWVIWIGDYGGGDYGGEIPAG